MNKYHIKYFWLAPLVISVIRNQLSHSVGLHTIEFIMCGCYKIAPATQPYMVVYYYFLFVFAMLKLRELWLPKAVYYTRQSELSF